MKTYFTFGQVHIHKIDNHTLDKDCVIEVEGHSEDDCRSKVYNAIGDKWAFSYPDTPPPMHYFPRGIIKLNL